MPETVEFNSPSPAPISKGEPATKPVPSPKPPSQANSATEHERPAGTGIWLYGAAAGLLVLSGAAAAVSFTAQYRLVFAARGIAVAAALEAGIPDAAALVFACLGVALALHGRHAIRARLLNVASAGTSVFMNVIAAAPGWRDVAVWVMPPTAYALASDTLIGVVRVRVAQGPTADDPTMLAMATGLLLWLLRLLLAPVSTIRGFHAWVVEECPVAPRRHARVHVEPAARALEVATGPQRGRGPRGGTKTARFLALVTEQHGPLAAIPVPAVSKISATVAPQVGLNAGSARSALRRAVLAAQDGGAR
jgi:hypothetical protein